MDRAVSFRSRLRNGTTPEDEASAAEATGPDGDRVVVLPHEIRAPSPARREFSVLYVCLAVTDGLGFTVALLATARLQLTSVLPAQILGMTVSSPLTVVGVFAWLGLYHSHVLSPAEEFRRLIAGISLAMVAIVMVSFWADVPFSRLWVALPWVFALVCTLATRRFWHWASERERERGAFTFRTAIVGGNEEATRLAGVLRRRNLGFGPVGFVAVDGSPVPRGLPVLGSISELRSVVRGAGIDMLFVATTAVGPNEIAKVQKVARREGAEVHVTANLPELLATRLSVEPLGGVMALSVRCASRVRRRSPSATATRGPGRCSSSETTRGSRGSGSGSAD